MAKPKVISMIQQKGGVGKSTLIDELAFEFERKKLTYNIYDIDGQGGLINHNHNYDNPEFYLVDTPGSLSENVVTTIKDSDLIIVPIKCSKKDEVALKTTLEVINKNKKKDAKVIIVANCYANNSGIWFMEGVIKKELEKYPYINTVITIPTNEGIVQAQMWGKSIIDHKYGTKKNICTQLAKLFAVVESHFGITI